MSSKVRVEEDVVDHRTIYPNPLILDDADSTVSCYGIWYRDTSLCTPHGWRISERCEERCDMHGLPAPRGGER